jgi:hypothetical protein
MGATVLGLIGVEQREREQIAERLGVAGMDLIEAARSYTSASRWHERGRVLTRLLETLPIRRSLCDEVLVCGAIAGLWGRPSRWDPGGPLGGVMVTPF